MYLVFKADECYRANKRLSGRSKDGNAGLAFNSVLNDNYRVLEREMVQMCNYSDGVLARGIRKGIQKGECQTLVSLVRQGLLQTADAAKQIHVTEEEFIERMKEVGQ